MEDTPVESLPDLFRDLRRNFDSGKTKPLEWRKEQLKQLYKMCEEQQDYFAAAARIDFYRPTAETLLYDCGVVSLTRRCLFFFSHFSMFI